MIHPRIISEELVKVAHDHDFWIHYFFYSEPGRSYPHIVNCLLRVAEDEFGVLRSDEEMGVDAESKYTTQEVCRIQIPVTGASGFIIDITPELDRTISLFHEGANPLSSASRNARSLILMCFVGKNSIISINMLLKRPRMLSEHRFSACCSVLSLLSRTRMT